MINTAPELLTKVEKLKMKRVEEAEQSRIERMQNIPNGEFSRMNCGNGNIDCIFMFVLVSLLSCNDRKERSIYISVVIFFFVF